MKLLFDLMATQPLNGIKNHGGSEYTKVVFNKLIKRIEADDVIHIIYNVKEMLDENIKNICRDHKIKLIGVRNKKEIEKLLNEQNYDKFFSGLGYSHRHLQIPSNTRFLSVVHGLRPIEMPSDIYERYYIKSFKERIIWLIKSLFKKQYLDYRKNDYRKFLLKYNKDIVVVSNHTKNSILSFFSQIAPNDIKVLYSPEKITPNLDVKDISRKKYFLMISASIWLKNSYRGIMALDNLFNRQEFSEYKAIILGGLPEKIKKDITNIDNFEFKGYVSEEELEQLYAEAYAFFYPTLNEGFGYPPLEAMKYGTPVVVSAITSIPEVCGDAAIYFNPFSIEEMTARLIEVGNKEYSELEIKSFSQYFSIKEKQSDDLERLIHWILD